MLSICSRAFCYSYSDGVPH
nr:unnamed protein product [Callosobruchus analis]